jgi:hypothetical protein
MLESRRNLNKLARISKNHHMLLYACRVKRLIWRGTDAVQGFSRRGGGAIVNLSRGLLSAFSSPDLGPIEIRQELEALAMKFNTQINSALKKMTHAD